MSINPPPPQYKGADLDAAKGPGLGCFWLQVVLLVTFVVLAPVGALNGWPIELVIAMFVAMLVLLLFVGQTAVFLLRLVAAERRGRRRPLASRTPTVGQLEEAEGAAARPDESPESGESGESAEAGVRE